MEVQKFSLQDIPITYHKFQKFSDYGDRLSLTTDRQNRYKQVNIKT